jgi:sporulation protein YlmC with PRC-barrel domain
MLRTASAINGYAIAASDGQLGAVTDFLFDDSTWLIRWLVVDTESWLSGRKVLLPPSVLGPVDSTEKQFSVSLTMQQVKDSPDIDTERPVSRQMETHIFDYYGWSPYWGTGFYMGGAMVAPPDLEFRAREEAREEAIAESRRVEQDPHLRSIKAVTGYHVHASDGEIGHVENFLLDDADWSIHSLIVDTKNWWPGKKVLIPPNSARKIDWLDRLVNLKINRQHVKDSPAYDHSAPAEPAFEANFRSYFSNIQHSEPY